MEKQNSFSNLISLPPFLPPNSGMESSRISGLQTFHYGRTDGRTDAEGRGGEGKAIPKNRFAWRRKTLSPAAAEKGKDGLEIGEESQCPCKNVPDGRGRGRSKVIR